MPPLTEPRWNWRALPKHLVCVWRPDLYVRGSPRSLGAGVLLAPSCAVAAPNTKPNVVACLSTLALTK
jgi:hypothetical protein